jgi:HAD superfamily hydrolase (TIGR01484 family)
MVKMVITDLDGTLLQDNKTVHERDYKTLHDLAKKGIVRVAATGRSLHLVENVLQKEFPFDYIIFSNGSGLCEWKSKRILLKKFLPGPKVNEIARKLETLNVSFMLHRPIPNNHYFKYFNGQQQTIDFLKRIDRYGEFCEPINGEGLESFGDACQFLLILPGDMYLFHKIKSLLDGVRVIRTTSPIDGDSLWMEIYNSDVNKGLTAKWLCNYLNIPEKQTLGVGNDYNDIDLLNFTKHSFVLENAPDLLKKDYPVVSANYNCGFTDAVQQVIDDHLSNHFRDNNAERTCR